MCATSYHEISSLAWSAYGDTASRFLVFWLREHARAKGLGVVGPYG